MEKGCGDMPGLPAAQRRWINGAKGKRKGTRLNLTALQQPLSHTRGYRGSTSRSLPQTSADTGTSPLRDPGPAPVPLPPRSPFGRRAPRRSGAAPAAQRPRRPAQAAEREAAASGAAVPGEANGWSAGAGLAEGPGGRGAALSPFVRLAGGGRSGHGPVAAGGGYRRGQRPSRERPGLPALRGNSPRVAPGGERRVLPPSLTSGRGRGAVPGVSGAAPPLPCVRQGRGLCRRSRSAPAGAPRAPAPPARPPAPPAAAGGGGDAARTEPPGCSGGCRRRSHSLLRFKAESHIRIPRNRPAFQFLKNRFTLCYLYSGSASDTGGGT